MVRSTRSSLPSSDCFLWLRCFWVKPHPTLPNPHANKKTPIKKTPKHAETYYAINWNTASQNGHALNPRECVLILAVKMSWAQRASAVPQGDKILLSRLKRSSSSPKLSALLSTHRNHTWICMYKINFHIHINTVNAHRKMKGTVLTVLKS